jgi:predicted SnoaL-like aldol condensation-catalyzing enzyme
MTNREPNKKVVVELMRLIAAGEAAVVLDLLHPDFVSHNPTVAHDPATATGKQAFSAFLDSPAGAQMLGTAIEVERVIADGDFVVVHSRFVRAEPPQVAAVDILRLRDGLVVEHWDVLQPIPATLAHPHGMV